MWVVIVLIPDHCLSIYFVCNFGLSECNVFNRINPIAPRTAKILCSFGYGGLAVLSTIGTI